MILAACNDLGLETIWIAAEAVGQADHLNRAGAVGEATDKAAFLKRSNQAVNAGFRAQIQRGFHLVKTGRDAVLLQTLVNKLQKLKLLFRQHSCPLCTMPFVYVLFMFPFCVNGSDHNENIKCSIKWQ